MSWLKRHLPKTRRFRVYLYILSTLLILLAADMGLVQYWRWIRISPETTRITGPLTAEGYPDYLAALNAETSKGVTNENNAAVLLVQLARASFPEVRRRELYARFGLSEAQPLVTATDYVKWLQAHDLSMTYQQAVSQSDDLLITQQQPWRAKDHLLCKQWLDDNAAALALVHRAVERERYYMPCLSSGGKAFGYSPGEMMPALSPAVGTYRGLSQKLVVRAWLQLGEGDRAGFESDIAANLKLARLVGQGSTLVEQLVAWAIDSQGLQAIQRAAETDRLDRASVEGLLGMLTALPPSMLVERAIDRGERYVFLDASYVAAQRGWAAMGFEGSGSGEAAQQSGGMAFLERYFGPIDYNRMMREGNDYYDHCVSALSQPTYREQRAAFNRLEGEMEAFKGRSILRRIMDPGLVLLADLTPSFDMLAKLQAQGGEMADLARAALQLRVYRLEHNAYPDTLAALGEAAASTDRFSDQPLIYRREGAGYVLYSVGPDGKDDGGRTREEDVKHTGRWDIVVRAEK